MGKESRQGMNDIEEIQNLYQEYYEAMMHKDLHVLDEILDDSFELIHMTGMHQSKQDYMNAIENGTLNYRWCHHDAMPVKINHAKAFLKGQTQVDAAVFGGSWHVWHLEQDLELEKKDGTWRIMHSTASTY